MAKKGAAVEKRPSIKQLNEQLNRVNTELALAEAEYMRGLMGSLMPFSEATGQLALGDIDERNWTQLSVGSQLTIEKQLTEARRDPSIMRRQSYWFWRFNPHGRGILRNYQRFIIGREFGFDMDDETHGVWNDDKTKLEKTGDVEDPLLVRLAWEDFAERNNFIQRAKEMVLRTFRDGDMFLRRFEKNGRIKLRFIEPSWVATPTTTGTNSTVQPGDFEDGDPDAPAVGEKTTIRDGIESLADDVETIVAYHVQKPGGISPEFERIPGKDVIHAKPLADSNDTRGICVLEVVAKRLTNYDQWEEYRMVLNKARTAVWLVRRIEGTALQAQQLIAGRLSPRPAPGRQEPVTTSARREAMPLPGTVLNPSAGVKYEYLTPNLQAADASEDGRRFQMSIAAGVGLPEMLVTGDWSNANYASAVEARTPAVREWEDWQDFFAPIFMKIYTWVQQAAQRGLGLPKTTSMIVTLRWPTLVQKDAAKETERNTALFTGGVMSKTTWAVREGLDYAEEVENLREEQELEATLPNNQDMEDALAGDGATTTPEDGTAPPAEDRPATQEGQLFLLARNLREMGEAIDSTIADPAMRTALKKYVKTTRALITKSMGDRPKRRRAKQWRAGRA